MRHGQSRPANDRSFLTIALRAYALAGVRFRRRRCDVSTINELAVSDLR